MQVHSVQTAELILLVQRLETDPNEFLVRSFGTAAGFYPSTLQSFFCGSLFGRLHNKPRRNEKHSCPQKQTLQFCSSTTPSTCTQFPFNLGPLTVRFGISAIVRECGASTSLEPRTASTVRKRKKEKAARAAWHKSPRSTFSRWVSPGSGHIVPTTSLRVPVNQHKDGSLTMEQSETRRAKTAFTGKNTRVQREKLWHSGIREEASIHGAKTLALEGSATSGAVAGGGGGKEQCGAG